MISITRVRVALSIAIEFLGERFVDASLRRLQDWHFAGEAITSARAVTWSELRYWVRSDNGVFQAATGEPDVCVGVYPDGGEFYLRFHVDAGARAPGQPLEAGFDVSGPAGLIVALCERLLADGVSETVLLSAADFFAL